MLAEFLPQSSSKPGSDAVQMQSCNTRDVFPVQFYNTNHVSYSIVSLLIVYCRTFRAIGNDLVDDHVQILPSDLLAVKILLDELEAILAKLLSKLWVGSGMVKKKQKKGIKVIPLLFLFNRL